MVSCQFHLLLDGRASPGAGAAGFSKSGVAVIMSALPRCAERAGDSARFLLFIYVLRRRRAAGQFSRRAYRLAMLDVWR